MRRSLVIQSAAFYLLVAVAVNAQGRASRPEAASLWGPVTNLAVLPLSKNDWASIPPDTTADAFKGRVSAMVHRPVRRRPPWSSRSQARWRDRTSSIAFAFGRGKPAISGTRCPDRNVGVAIFRRHTRLPRAPR